MPENVYINNKRYAVSEYLQTYISLLKDTIQVRSYKHYIPPSQGEPSKVHFEMKLQKSDSLASQLDIKYGIFRLRFSIPQIWKNKGYHSNRSSQLLKVPNQKLRYTFYRISIEESTLSTNSSKQLHIITDTSYFTCSPVRGVVDAKFTTSLRVQCLIDMIKAFGDYEISCTSLIKIDVRIFKV